VQNEEITILAPSVLKIRDTINIYIPDSIPNPFSRSNLNWNANDDFLGFVGDPKNDELPIHVYDFNKENWFNIPMKAEGPNQVYGLGTFSFNTDSTLYYFPSVVQKSFKANFQGKVIDAGEFSIKFGHGINNTVFNPQIMQDGTKIGFLSMQFLDMDVIKNYELAKLFTIYDFKTKESNHIINFPKEFLGRVWSMNDQSMTSLFENNKIIINFSKSHFLYVYNTSGDLERKINVKVKGVGNAKPLENGSAGAINDMLKTYATGKYSSLIYDKWRKVYYRVGKYYDINNFAPKNIKELNSMRHKQVYVIVVLNESLEVIGTDYFNQSEININDSNYFINENGLYLHLSNYDDENMLSYVRMDLKK